MNIKELLKQLNEKYPVVEDQHSITYNSELDCLTIWVYIIKYGTHLCNGFNFLESELENIELIMKEIEEIINN